MENGKYEKTEILVQGRIKWRMAMISPALLTEHNQLKILHRFPFMEFITFIGFLISKTRVLGVQETQIREFINIHPCSNYEISRSFLGQFFLRY